MDKNPPTAEHKRLADQRAGLADWRHWGTYLSERAWGTVREDYSPNGDAWNYFPFEQAAKRVYRWNEDGLGGVCDSQQVLCLAVGLWNERDPILKERLFGLNNQQGNHGEDVKEYYFYLDGTPTHSYMKMLYRYPQAAFPYAALVQANNGRSPQEPEFELLDALQDDFNLHRFLDVQIEYAKLNPEDLLGRITITNPGPEPAPIHVLPQLWYRNTWTWEEGLERPVIKSVGAGAAYTECEVLGERWWYARVAGGEPLELLFTENESNLADLFGTPNPAPFVKDGIQAAVVNGQRDKVSLEQGSKLAGHTRAILPPGGTLAVWVRFSAEPFDAPFQDFEATFAKRIAEADKFYAAVQPAGLSPDERLVQRQACAGLLWSKQFYHYDVERWLKGDPTQPPPPPERLQGRNAAWLHLDNADVILMPDAWEYPWYASWDLAFHCVAIARLDPDFAKRQLQLMGYEWYQHGSGQYPAYEWDYNDVNPPVLAWAALEVYRIDRHLGSVADLEFLEEMFHSLMLSFNWWVNRKDASGQNIFGGGFLGMDNIGLFDRDKPLPTGGKLEQSDGTSWMANFSLNMLAIACELAFTNPAYENMAVKYFEQYLYIAHAMTKMGRQELDLWDDDDQFFYDVISLPDGSNLPLRVHSMVGLVPLCAVLVFRPELFASLLMLEKRMRWFAEKRPHLTRLVSAHEIPGKKGARLMALLYGEKLKRVLGRMLDPDEFLSDHGIRSLSAYHRQHPFEFEAGGQVFEVRYLPAESDNRLFGGNSNWRGPIWFPVNYLLVRSLQEFGRYYGDDLKVEFPTGSGKKLSLPEIAASLSQRLVSIFLRDPVSQTRPVFGKNALFQNDPLWRDYIPFHEYFHGDSGAGLGASHQTGWTALVASLLAGPEAEQEEEA
jgi:hypothetical protein